MTRNLGDQIVYSFSFIERMKDLNIFFHRFKKILYNCNCWNTSSSWVEVGKNKYMSHRKN